MSVTLGIYDVFANIIPGFVYLFVFNESLKAFGLSFVNLASLNTFPQFLLLTMLAYIVGHVMDYVSYRIWVRVFYKTPAEFKAYKQLQDRYPELGVTLKPEQWSLLFTIIRQKNYQLADNIEKNKVVCIMLRNVSFALVLLFLLDAYLAFTHSFNFVNLLAALGSLVGSIITLRRAEAMDRYYYRLIFENVALEGKNLKSIMAKLNLAKNKQKKGA